jgi:hypothetical protein
MHEPPLPQTAEEDTASETGLRSGAALNASGAIHHGNDDENIHKPRLGAFHRNAVVGPEGALGHDSACADETP